MRPSSNSWSIAPTIPRRRSRARGAGVLPGTPFMSSPAAARSGGATSGPRPRLTPRPTLSARPRATGSLFPGAKTLRAARAAEAALKKADAPGILHIATHGFFLQTAGENPGPAAAAPGDTRAATATSRIENPLLRSGLALAGA